MSPFDQRAALALESEISAVVTEAEIVAAIQASDRYRPRDGYSLGAQTSALAEIWGRMMYERVTEVDIKSLSAKQLSALEESRQRELFTTDADDSLQGRLSIG